MFFAQLRWGGYPGNAPEDIQSGAGRGEFDRIFFSGGGGGVEAFIYIFVFLCVCMILTFICRCG